MNNNYYSDDLNLMIGLFYYFDMFDMHSSYHTYEVKKCRLPLVIWQFHKCQINSVAFQLCKSRKGPVEIQSYF